MIVPTQPSVGLVKLMQRSQVSPGTVFWTVNVLKPSSVWMIWPALLIAQPTCGSDEPDVVVALRARRIGGAAT